LIHWFHRHTLTLRCAALLGFMPVLQAAPTASGRMRRSVYLIDRA
jgi:hypothetical protein